MGSFPSFLGSNLTTKGGLKSALGGQFGANSQLMNDTQGNRSAESGTLLPGYQSLANGGTPGDNNALEQGVLTPLRGAFNSARTAAGNRVATTGNSAGYGSVLHSLARTEGQQSAAAGFDIAGEKFKRKMAGLQGIAQMYGVDTSFLNSLGGQQEGLLGIGSGVESRRRGVLGNISTGLGVAAKALAL